MKLTLALATFLIALGGLHAATTAPVPPTPVGVINIPLAAATNNFVGISLVPLSSYAGTFNVSASDPAHRTINLTAAGVTLTNGEFNSPPCFIEVTSAGAAVGFNSPIVNSLAAGNTVTLLDALPSTVANGSTCIIRPQWNLSAVFGATNTTGLTGATTSAAADLIEVPNATGSFDQFFYSTGGAVGTGWRMVGGGVTDYSLHPLYPTDGFIIVNRGAAKKIAVAGTIKVGVTSVLFETGTNYVANLCPVSATTSASEGRTLGNSGLYNGTVNGLTGAATSTAADQVLIPNGTGYAQYYYSTGGAVGTGWRKIGAGSTDQSGTALPVGLYIVQRLGAPVVVQLSQAVF